MIVVTGTMRSGTSMWMQILRAAGFPVIGAEFPGKWRERIGEANPLGFFESLLRDGIYHRTNPHPKSGTYLRPEQTRKHAVKVFVRGLVRSDLAFLDRVLLSMRPFREFSRSLSRLMEMERAAKSEEEGRPLPLLPHLPHPLLWWDDNFGALRDSLVRGYPTAAIAYDSVLEDPARLVSILRELGAPEPEQGVHVVDSRQRTQYSNVSDTSDYDPEEGLDPEAILVFDELYERVRAKAGLDMAFIERLNQLDERLNPLIQRERRRVKSDLLRHAKEQQAYRTAANGRGDTSYLAHVLFGSPDQFPSDDDSLPA